MQNLEQILGVQTAYAQYSTSTAVTDQNALVADVGSTLQGEIPVILALLAALIGLGWGVRKFMRHVSGKKF